MVNEPLWEVAVPDPLYALSRYWYVESSRSPESDTVTVCGALEVALTDPPVSEPKDPLRPYDMIHDVVWPFPLSVKDSFAPPEVRLTTAGAVSTGASSPMRETRAGWAFPTNQTLPSGPVAMPFGSEPLVTLATDFTSPDVSMLPTLLPSRRVNHSRPPALAMPVGAASSGIPLP